MWHYFYLLFQENEIFAIGIPDCGKFFRSVWKRLVTDELGCEISWISVSGKVSLQNLAITSAFKGNLLKLVFGFLN